MSTTQAWVAALAALACYSTCTRKCVLRWQAHLHSDSSGPSLVTMYAPPSSPSKNTYVLKQGWWWMWVFFVMGVLYYARFLPAKWSWVARYPIAIQVGWALGAYFSISPRPYVVQMIDTIKALSSFENILFFLMFATAMTYFFFTLARKTKLVTASAQWGRWI